MRTSRILSAAAFAVAFAMVPLAAGAQDSSPEVVAVSGGAVAIIEAGEPGGVVVLPPEGGGPITDSDETWFVSTEGAVGVDGYVSSEASLVLGESGIYSWCDANASGATGGAQFSGNDIPPEVPEFPAPNTVMEIEGQTVTLNEQIVSEDGLSITVNALHATINLGDAVVEIVYAQSSCGVELEAVPVTPVLPTDDAAEPARVVPRFTG